jgi:hypothetical protein
MKISRSSVMPSSNLRFTDASTASTHFTGAGKFLAIARTVLRANWKYASGLGCVDLRSRTSGSGRTSATSRAKAVAPSIRSPSIMRSISFCPGRLASSSLFTGSPLTIMFSAVSTPSARGRRCVPPAPGIRPIFTSGRPICAPGAATR